LSRIVFPPTEIDAVGMARVPDHRNGLDVGAVGIAWHEADRLELLGDVGDRAILTGSSGCATLEAVGGEAVDVLQEVLARDRGQRWLQRRGGHAGIMARPVGARAAGGDTEGDETDGSTDGGHVQGCSVGGRRKLCVAHTPT
jgi:hypothetical protein